VIYWQHTHTHTHTHKPARSSQSIRTPVKRGTSHTTQHPLELWAFVQESEQVLDMNEVACAQCRRAEQSSSNNSWVGVFYRGHCEGFGDTDASRQGCNAYSIILRRQRQGYSGYSELWRKWLCEKGEQWLSTSCTTKFSNQSLQPSWSPIKFPSLFVAEFDGTQRPRGFIPGLMWELIIIQVAACAPSFCTCLILHLFLLFFYKSVEISCMPHTLFFFCSFMYVSRFCTCRLLSKKKVLLFFYVCVEIFVHASWFLILSSLCVCLKVKWPEP
jgi:hypothetical protein